MNIRQHLYRFVWLAAAWAATAQAWGNGLPQGLTQALLKAGIPQEAVSIHVQPVDGGAPLLSVNAAQPMNPASTMKLVTTYAALARLGPAYTWKTVVCFRRFNELFAEWGGAFVHSTYLHFASGGANMGFEYDINRPIESLAEGTLISVREAMDNMFHQDRVLIKMVKDYELDG